MQYIVPCIDNIPNCLKDLTHSDILALRPVDVHIGDYKQMKHDYRQKNKCVPHNMVGLVTRRENISDRFPTYSYNVTCRLPLPNVFQRQCVLSLRQQAITINFYREKTQHVCDGKFTRN